MKTANTNTAANTWTFSPETVTVNGRTFPASYSLARSGDVYVFVTVQESADSQGIPVRMHIGATMPMHADAVAAAKAARKPAKDASKAAAPAPVDKPAPVQEAPTQSEPAPAKAEQPAKKPVKKPASPAKDKPAKDASKAAAPVDKPAPVQEAPTQSKPAPVGDKSWIGTTITGKGWNIAFDAQAGRTRVLFQATPSDAQKAAIESAGFFWSAAMNSWNKGLTCKAHRAAVALAAQLAALA